jgi:hypothetical protein
MSESTGIGAAGHAMAPHANPHELIAALRREHAHLSDPVGFHHLENLAQRTSAQSGTVQRILNAKLVELVHQYRGRIASVGGNATGKVAAQCTAQKDTLRSLVQLLAAHEPHRSDVRTSAPGAGPSELKSVKYFRNTWSKLSVDQQVKNAMLQAPQNAGPINSHMVSLRSLTLMRDISPDYLNRFMTYMDSLSCLDQADKKPQAPQPKTRAGTPPAR